MADNPVTGWKMLHRAGSVLSCPFDSVGFRPDEWTGSPDGVSAYATILDALSASLGATDVLARVELRGAAPASDDGEIDADAIQVTDTGIWTDADSLALVIEQARMFHASLTGTADTWRRLVLNVWITAAEAVAEGHPLPPGKINNHIAGLIDSGDHVASAIARALKHYSGERAPVLRSLGADFWDHGTDEALCAEIRAKAEAWAVARYDTLPRVW